MKTGSRWHIAAFIVAVATAMLGARAQAQSCLGDLNGNGEVNGEDLGILLADWGPCPTGTAACPPDLNGDTFVNADDLGLLLNAWGPCVANCPADLTSDGVVNGDDVGVLLSAWGPCLS